MKNKLFILPLLVACSALNAAAGSGSNARAAQTLPKNPTFLQIRNAFLTKEKADSIKSVRIIYSIESLNQKKSHMMIRAKRYDHVRLDIVQDNKILTAVRDGDNFWMYDNKDGYALMNREDAISFAEYIAMLPVPFTKDKLFTNPVFKNRETVQNVVRSCYEVKPINNPKFSCIMSVEDKTRILRKVRVVDKDDKEGRILYFRDYKDFNGVKMPCTTTLVQVRGQSRLSLLHVDWNLEINDSVFNKKSKIKDRDLEILIHSPAAQEAKLDNSKLAKNKKRITTLKNSIRRLKIQLADNEQKLKRLEMVYKSDRGSSTSLAGSSSASSGRHYWNGYGWGYHSDTNARRDSRTKRKMVKELEKEVDQIVREYDDLSKKVLQQRLDLSDMEEELKRLSEKSER